jgi:hypothetical protein
MGVVECWAARDRPAVAGDLHRPRRRERGHDDLLAVPPDQTLLPARRCGSEYWPPSKLTIAVVDPTRRVCPSSAVNGYLPSHRWIVDLS